MPHPAPPFSIPACSYISVGMHYSYTTVTTVTLQLPVTPHLHYSYTTVTLQLPVTPHLYHSYTTVTLVTLVTPQLHYIYTTFTPQLHCS